MNNKKLKEAFSELSTPLISDACMRLGVFMRVAPIGIRPLVAGWKIAGRVLPVRHSGSVDIFLEVMAGANAGDILTVDNAARRHEGCIGDLTVLEAQAMGLGGIAVWGFHRDTPELIRIGFPVFSYGAFPVGPKRAYPRGSDALSTARFGDFFKLQSSDPHQIVRVGFFKYGRFVHILTQTRKGSVWASQPSSNLLTQETLNPHMHLDFYRAADLLQMLAKGVSRIFAAFF